MLIGAKPCQEVTWTDGKLMHLIPEGSEVLRDLLVPYFYKKVRQKENSVLACVQNMKERKKERSSYGKNERYAQREEEKKRKKNKKGKMKERTKKRKYAQRKKERNMAVNKEKKF